MDKSKSTSTMIRFIEQNRFKLNNYAAILIRNIKMDFASKIVPIKTYHHQYYLHGYPKIVFDNEPEVYLTGGSAYITYDTFFNHLSPMVAHNAPMEHNAPATYDWDITVHLKKKLTFPEQLEIFKFFQSMLVFIPGLKCDMPKVDNDDFTYYNYEFYMIFDGIAHNIFEVSFKPNPYYIKDINILHIADNYELPPVPNLISLMSLSLIAIDNRAPIKIKDKNTGKFRKNDKFHKCIQDYYRIMFILRTMDLYRPNLIHLIPIIPETFKKIFNDLIERHPHCKTNIFIQPKMNKIDQQKRNKLSKELWQTAQVKQSAQKAAQVKQSAQKAAQVKQSAQKAAQVKQSAQKATQVKQSAQKAAQVKQSAQKAAQVKQPAQKAAHQKKIEK